ncbi:hypothetical protein V5799_020433, partial [Amblyomma americanum]
MPGGRACKICEGCCRCFGGGEGEAAQEESQQLADQPQQEGEAGGAGVPAIPMVPVVSPPVAIGPPAAPGTVDRGTDMADDVRRRMGVPYVTPIFNVDDPPSSGTEPTMLPSERRGDDTSEESSTSGIVMPSAEADSELSPPTVTTGSADKSGLDSEEKPEASISSVTVPSEPIPSPFRRRCSIQNLLNGVHCALLQICGAFVVSWFLQLRKAKESVVYKHS